MKLRVLQNVRILINWSTLFISWINLLGNTKELMISCFLGLVTIIYTLFCKIWELKVTKVKILINLLFMIDQGIRGESIKDPVEWLFLNSFKKLKNTMIIWKNYRKKIKILFFLMSPKMNC